MSNVYEVGALARLLVTFTDVNSVVADPTTIAVTVQDPAGAQTVYTYAIGQVQRTSTGLYYYDLTVTQVGDYLYRWNGAGALVAVMEGSITVAATTLVPPPPSISGSPVFSYQFGANPSIDYVRMLASDTVQFDAQGNRAYAFTDSEILAASRIEAAVWQSGMFFTPPGGSPTLPIVPVSYRRAAATLLDALAANQARLGIISKLLDVTLNPNAAASLRAQAASLREIDDNTGSFVIIEQVNDQFSFRDRFLKQVQRQTGGWIGA